MYCEEDDKEEKMDEEEEEEEDVSAEMREVGEKRQRSTVHKVIEFVINDMTCKPQQHV